MPRKVSLVSGVNGTCSCTTAEGGVPFPVELPLFALTALALALFPAWGENALSSGCPASSYFFSGPPTDSRSAPPVQTGLILSQGWWMLRHALFTLFITVLDISCWFCNLIQPNGIVWGSSCVGCGGRKVHRKLLLSLRSSIGVCGGDRPQSGASPCVVGSLRMWNATVPSTLQLSLHPQFLVTVGTTHYVRTWSPWLIVRRNHSEFYTLVFSSWSWVVLSHLFKLSQPVYFDRRWVCFDGESTRNLWVWCHVSPLEIEARETSFMFHWLSGYLDVLLLQSSTFCIIPCVCVYLRAHICVVKDGKAIGTSTQRSIWIVLEAKKNKWHITNLDPFTCFW